MLVWLVLVNLLLCQSMASVEEEEESDDDFGANLVAVMRNDANLDLPVDEEYEDLRAELLAYHTTLAKLTSSSQGRRSMMSTPCWELGGICVEYKLCTGFRFLTEVPGCKDKLNVCCFTWNKFKVKDMRDKGIQTLAYPWLQHIEFGGLGVVEKKKDKKKKKNRKNKHKHNEVENQPIEEQHDSEENLRQHKRNEEKTIALILKPNK